MFRVSHLCVVLLQVGELILQAFDLHLQVGLGQGGLVQQAAEVGDVSLDGLAHYQLVFESNQVVEIQISNMEQLVPVKSACWTSFESFVLLGFEVICCQFGVINLKQDVGISNGGSVDLERKQQMNT